MIIIGVDFHPEFQQIALVDTDTGELEAGEENIAFSPSTCARQLYQLRILIHSEFTAVTEP